jgi:hypothetical protein
MFFVFFLPKLILATANSLGKNLGMQELVWEEKKQKTLGNF